MTHFICPVCGRELNDSGKSLRCENSHSFDAAKSGYVNLLMSRQAKDRHHGDDKAMVRARRDFLNKGYYNPLLEELFQVTEQYAGDGCRILDAGCGECWYTAHIYSGLLEKNIRPEMIAVDISKDALAAGAKRSRDISLAVASVFRLPVRDASCDVVLSLFAPFARDEFIRVLKDGGVVIRVIPLEKHLLRLKEAVYDSVYENEPEEFDFKGFALADTREVRGTIHLKSNEDIQNVFAMTPYYHKTGAKDREKLTLIDELDTEIEFGILTYRKE